MLSLLGAPAQPKDLNDPLADWFLVVLTAGPEGARNFEATYQTNGRTPGAPMVSGGAIADGDSAGGGVSSAWSGVRVGLAGAADLTVDVMPPAGPGTFWSSHRIFGGEIEPGGRIYSLSFTSGTRSRASPVTTKAAEGSISAEIQTGTGSAAILLLDTKDGVGAEVIAGGGAVSASYPIDSPGLVGGFTSCHACVGEWKSPDARTGVSRTGAGSFAGPSGRWRLSWSGLSDPGLSWATVGGYAPIGEHWKHFRFPTSLV